eukprot:6411645-Amphidinium_carterae.1
MQYLLYPAFARARIVLRGSSLRYVIPSAARSSRSAERPAKGRWCCATPAGVASRGNDDVGDAMDKPSHVAFISSWICAALLAHADEEPALTRLRQSH